MFKGILGVVVGYIAFLFFFFVVFTGLYVALGAERVFQPGTFQISALWILLALIGALIGGLLAGFVCHAISRSMRACRVFAIIVLLLSLAMCLPVMLADKTPRPRTGELPAMEAMQQGQAPVWMHLLSAVLSGGGVLIGAAMRKGSSK